MKSRYKISLLTGAILVSVMLLGVTYSSSAPKQDEVYILPGMVYSMPDNLTPVWEWKNGFTLEQAKQFIEDYNSTSFVKGDDIGTYAYLHVSEVLPVAKILRKGDVVNLDVDIDPSIGKFKVDGLLGNQTLEEIMRDKRSRAQGIIVLKKGKIVYEKYPGMPQDGSHAWMSCSKVVTGLIIHMLEQKGLLSIDDNVVKYIPEYKGTDWDGIKLSDILHQQSGMDLVENTKNISNPKSPVSRGYAFTFSPKGATSDSSILDIMKDVKLYLEPGTQFDYTSFNSHILGIVIENVTGKKFADVFTDLIWAKAGMEGDAEMIITPIGEALNAGGLTSRLRDKARFALLFTPSWSTVSKTKIVDDDYFQNVYSSGNSAAFLSEGSDMRARLIHELKETPSHASYQWDAVFEDGDLYKAGKNGQGIYVSPKKDIAVVWFSNTYNNAYWLPIYARAIVKKIGQTQ